MSKTLTDAQVSRFREDGFLFPHEVYSPEEAAAFIATIPMGRVGECEQDIGEFVAFLCSDTARYVSGQSIAVDGGQAYMP